MANNYVRPALNVYQLLDDTVTTAGDHLSTCVVGANYELYRYGHEELTPVAYSTTAQYAFSGVEKTKTGYSYSLDSQDDNISVYGEDMEAQIMGTLGYSGGFSGYYSVSASQVNGCYTGVVDAGTDPFVLDTGRVIAFAAGYTGTIDPALQGYYAEIGDKVYVADVTDATTQDASIVPDTDANQTYYTNPFTNAAGATENYVRLSYTGLGSDGVGISDIDSRYKVIVASEPEYSTGSGALIKASFNIVNVYNENESYGPITFDSIAPGTVYSNVLKDASSPYCGLRLDIKVSASTSNVAKLYYSSSNPNASDYFMTDAIAKHINVAASNVISGNVISLIGAQEDPSLTAGTPSVTSVTGYSGFTTDGGANSVVISGAGSGSSNYSSAYSTVFVAKVTDITYCENSSYDTETTTPTSYIKNVTFTVTDTTGRISDKTVTFTYNDLADGTEKDIDTTSLPGLKLTLKHNATAETTTLYYSSTVSGSGDAFPFYYTPAYESTTKFTGVRCDTPLCSIAKMEASTKVTTAYVMTKPVDAVLENYKVVTTGVTTPYLQLGTNVIDLPGREDVPFALGKGDVYISYRVEVIPPESDDIIDITDTTDIQEQLGTIDPDNDIAYGAYCALKGASGKTVYALRTRGTAASDFTTAMGKTEADSSLYNFCPMTDSVSVMDAVFTYNATQSTAERKHWRVNFFGPQAVQDYVVASTDTEGHSIMCAIIKSAGKSMVVLNNDVKLDFTAIPLNGTTVSLYPGDEIQILAEQGTGRYVINSVTKTTLELVSGPTTTYGLTAIALWKTDTAKNAAEYVESVADNFSDRRACVVWSDNAMNSDGVLDNKYLASTVAGMSSSFLPQAPMTRAEVPTVTSAQRMYTRYTQDALDDIAEHGVMIVTQDTKGGSCYVRHQLTTEMDKGILYQELSITRNLDNISYAVVDAFETYIGRANVTDSAIDALYAKALTLLNHFMTNSTDAKIGPSLGKFEKLQVYQDPTFLTRVILKVNLYLPVPMNNIDVYEMAFAYDTVSGYTEITVEATA